MSEANADRARNIRMIDSLNGIPGDCGSETIATALLVDVVSRLGYDALSDAGIEALAAAHKRRDDNL